MNGAFSSAYAGFRSICLILWAVPAIILILALIDLIQGREEKGIRRADTGFILCWYYGLFYFFLASFMKFNLTGLFSSLSSFDSLISSLASGGLLNLLGNGFFFLMLFTFSAMVLSRKKITCRELYVLSLSVLLFFTSLMPWIRVNISIFSSSASLSVSLLDIGSVGMGVLTAGFAETGESVLTVLLLSLLFFIPAAEAGVISALVTGKDRKVQKSLNVISIVLIVLSLLFFLVVEGVNDSMKSSFFAMFTLGYGSGAGLSLVLSLTSLFLLKGMLARVKKGQTVPGLFLKILDPDSTVSFIKPKAGREDPGKTAPLVEYEDVELKNT